MTRRINLALSDAWSTFANATLAAPTFAWHDGGDGLCFVAWGEVAAFEGDPVAASAWSSKINERLAEHTPLAAALPLLVGGFSFAGRPGSGCWGGWPTAKLWVPQFLAYRLESGDCGLIVRYLEGSTDAPSPAQSDTLSTRDPQGICVQVATAVERDDYCELVRRAVNDIAGGTLGKVVVARRTRVTAPAGRAMDPVSTSFALRASAPAATSFALTLDGSDFFVGATPETLVRVSGRRLRTHAVAGTSCVASDRDGTQLSASRKNQHEHALVVTSIGEALAPLCTDVETAAPRLLDAGVVRHLLSPIVAQLRSQHGVLDAVARLHPTAALCGTPTLEATRWLGRHEQLNRGWYGAPVGWVAPNGDGVFAVAIRSALLKDQHAFAFAGAGIVRDSDPVDEWRETEAKLRTATCALRVGRRA